MNLRTKYKRYFRTACTTLLLLAFVGCAKDKPAEYGSGDATGQPESRYSPRYRACINEWICRR